MFLEKIRLSYMLLLYNYLVIPLFRLRNSVSAGLSRFYICDVHKKTTVSDPYYYILCYSLKQSTDNYYKGDDVLPNNNGRSFNEEQINGPEYEKGKHNQVSFRGICLATIWGSHYNPRSWSLAVQPLMTRAVNSGVGSSNACSGYILSVVWHKSIRQTSSVLHQ